jgi:hypothetical protein
MMKILSLSLGLSWCLAQTAFAGSYCKKDKPRSVAEQIATLALNVDFDLDLDIFSGGSAVAGYEYEVGPAYTKGLYTRTDRWFMNLNATPGAQIDLSGNYDIGLNGGVSNQTEATFVRFMKDPCTAMLSKPYSPRRMPLKSKTALGPLFNPGDYFFFRGSAGFVTSAEILSMLGSSFWGVGLSGNYLMEGFYQLHIVRLDEERIRLKIIGHRGKGAGVSVGIGFEEEFDVFGVSALDNQLEKFINTKPVKIRGDYKRSKIFMVDYVLNLTDPSVAEAFDNVLMKVKSLRNIEMSSLFKNRDDIEGAILLDLTPLEDLYRTDYNAGNVGRIKRNLRTTSDQDTYGFGIQAGNKILGFKLDTSISTSRLGIRNDDNFLDRFLLRTWEKSSEGRFLYKWYRSRKEDGLRAIFRTNEEFNQLVPINVVRYKTEKKNRFSYSDFVELKKNLKKSLPIEIFNDIPWSQWNQKPGEKFYNYGLRSEILMSPESIMEAPELSEEEVKVFFREFMLRQNLEETDYFMETQTYERNTAPKTFDVVLSSMARKLSQALSRKISMNDRLEIIAKLRMNTLFAESGLGFLMSLQPARIKSLYHLDLNISSNESIIDYSFGHSEMSELYKKILTIKAALDDDALDLLREAESLSMKEAG